MKEYKNEIISIILIIILGTASIIAAYTLYGPQAGRMTLAACGIIAYLVVKDILDKRKKRKERELARNGGKVVMSVSSERDKRVDIGSIAHRSTKKLNPSGNKPEQVSGSPASPCQENEKGLSH